MWDRVATRNAACRSRDRRLYGRPLLVQWTVEVGVVVQDPEVARLGGRRQDASTSEMARCWLRSANLGLPIEGSLMSGAGHGYRGERSQPIGYLVANFKDDGVATLWTGLDQPTARRACRCGWDEVTSTIVPTMTDTCFLWPPAGPSRRGYARPRLSGGRSRP